MPAWKYFPPVKVAADVVGPTFRPKKNLGTAKLPFREAVAIALAKQVCALLTLHHRVSIPCVLLLLGMSSENVVCYTKYMCHWSSWFLDRGVMKI